MKKFSSALAALAALVVMGVSPVALVVSPAQASATPGCVTKAEFRAISRGTSLGTVREIIGAKGRVTSSNYFDDGDAWKTVDFRQCNRTWYRSSVSFDVELTEREVYVPDRYCDSYGCEDYGDYETRYSYPYVVTGKSAYWS